MCNIARSAPASSHLLPSEIGAEGKERAPHPVSLGGREPFKNIDWADSGFPRGPEIVFYKALV